MKVMQAFWGESDMNKNTYLVVVKGFCTELQTCLGSSQHFSSHTVEHGAGVYVPP